MGIAIADTICHVAKLAPSPPRSPSPSFQTTSPIPKTGGGSGIVPTAAMAAKPVMVIGIDDSECAIAALEWTLDQFFFPTSRLRPFKLVVVHVKPSPDVFVGVTGAGRIAGSVETYQALDGNLKRKAATIIDMAREICTAKSVCDVEFEVDEGDARYVLCEAVDKHRASVLVVGSRGHGTIRRAFLGSVSDYCAHQARRSVMIVKINGPRKTGP